MSSQVLGRDPVKAALEAARRFSSVFNEKCHGKAPALPRRLKEFPQILLQAGLIPALTFYASKLDEDKKWTIFIDTLRVLEGAPSQAIDNTICSDVEGEGGGYAHALAIIYAYAAPIAGCNLEDIASPTQTGSSKDKKALATARVKFVECLNTISKKGVVAESLVLAYANEVKKLFTALYSEK